MCGTSEAFLMCYVLLSLFLRTELSISARIPLQSALWAASFPPGEA